MVSLFAIPCLLAVSLFSTQIYGFNSVIFAYTRVLMLSNGGFLLENTTKLGIKENLSWVDFTTFIEKVLFFGILFVGQFVTLTVISVYVSKIRDDLLKARKYEQ